MIASGALMIIIGLWLLLQSIAGGLPERLLSLRSATKSTANSGGSGSW